MKHLELCNYLNSFIKRKTMKLKNIKKLVLNPSYKQMKHEFKSIDLCLFLDELVVNRSQVKYDDIVLWTLTY